MAHRSLVHGPWDFAFRGLGCRVKRQGVGRLYLGFASMHGASSNGCDQVLRVYRDLYKVWQVFTEFHRFFQPNTSVGFGVLKAMLSVLVSGVWRSG